MGLDEITSGDRVDRKEKKTQEKIDFFISDIMAELDEFLLKLHA